MWRPREVIRPRFLARPAPPQTCRGAKAGDTVSSIACLGRKRPAGDSISAAGGVLGRREACWAWWWAWRCGVFHLQGAFSGDFFLFFSSYENWGILGSRPPEIELRTEAQSPSSVNCNECIPKKNRHSESVPRIHALFLTEQHADEVRGMAKKNGQLYPPRGPIGFFRGVETTTGGGESVVWTPYSGRIQDSGIRL